jgi:hypothetical protein
MRRFLSFLMASAILLAGLALAAAEVVRGEGNDPFLLVGMGLMIGAAGVWLVDEFLRTGKMAGQPRPSHHVVALRRAACLRHSQRS